MKNKIVYVDMDNVLVDFPSALGRIEPYFLREYENRLDEIPDLFSLMEPLKDAIESYEKIAGIYDTYILSTSPWLNPSAWSDKLKWVQKHLGQRLHTKD